MNDIIKILKKADDIYYNSGTEWISDEVYDNLKDMSLELYPNNDYFTGIGSPVKENKVKLPYILGSLNKFDKEDVDKWIHKGSNEILISEKLDGVSILVIYFKGKVIFACTRGDGEYGRDITEKAKVFCGDIQNKDKNVLRGECVIKKDADYSKLGYKTPRNMSSGILNRDDDKHVDLLVPYFYEVIEPHFEDEKSRIDYISIHLGLNTPRYILKTRPKPEELVNLLEFYKSESYYDIDGLVLTRNNYVRENVKYPENKVKFKIHAKSIPTKVKSIEWNTGRTGRIIPTIIIDPVVIDNVTINRSTGFNAQFIKDNNISEGSEIKILRSGDVIPYITEVTKREDKPDIPETCPKCNGKVEWKGVDIICVNDKCSESSIKKTEFFLRTLGVENVTRKTLEKIGISTIFEVYDIDELEITSNVGIGLKKSEMIVNEIEKTLKTTPDKLLASFGIPNVGKSLSEIICSKYSFDELFTLTEDQLVEIEGIGKVIAKKFVDNINKHRELYEFLKSRGLRFTTDEIDSKIKGKTFTLTGSMPLKRDVIKRMIEENGGVVRNISKKVDYLVNENKDKETVKVKKAKEYGVNIISYNDLMEMINE